MDTHDSNLDLLFSEVRRLGSRMAELENRVDTAIDDCRKQLNGITLEIEAARKQTEQLRNRFDYLEARLKILR